MSRWLYYALGGGLGHLTRAVALARQAARRGVEIEILTNSPYVSAVAASGSANLRRFPIDVAPERVRDAVRTTPCDALIVDTFPRGLGGELATLLDELTIPKVLVHRDLDPRYVRDVRLADHVARYALVLVPGEDAPLAAAPNAVRTAPWLTLDASELLAPDAARRALDANGKIVAVLASGREEEGPMYARVAARIDAALDVDVRLLVPTPRDDLPEARALWPFLAYVRGVDVVVGGGGYNTVQEARATRTPFVGIAMPRKYDRQHVRLRGDERSTEEGVVERVAQRLRKSRHDVPQYDNGATHAVELIAARLAACPLRDCGT
ncbi:MAG: hypothetical protein RMA76_18355 [Deltaproteobacteria bacterium]